MSATYQAPQVDGPAVTRTWTTIAADREGVVDEDAIGVRRRETDRRFSQRRDAEAWLLAMSARGYMVEGPTPLACVYFGESDSPSNAWSARAWIELANVNGEDVAISPRTGGLVPVETEGGRCV